MEQATDDFNTRAAMPSIILECCETTNMCRDAAWSTPKGNMILGYYMVCKRAIKARLWDDTLVKFHSHFERLAQNPAVVDVDGVSPSRSTFLHRASSNVLISVSC